MPYDRRFRREDFDCGHAALNDWLRTSASPQQRSGNARTFLAVDSIGDRVLGYFALTAYRLDLHEVVVITIGHRREVDRQPCRSLGRAALPPHDADAITVRSVRCPSEDFPSRAREGLLAVLWVMRDD